MVNQPLVLRVRDTIGRPLSLGMGGVLVVLEVMSLYLVFVGQPSRWWAVGLVGVAVVVTLLGYQFDSRIDEWADHRGISVERVLRSVLVGLMGGNLVFLLWMSQSSTPSSQGHIGTFLLAIGVLGAISVVGAVLVYRLELRRRLQTLLSA